MATRAESGPRVEQGPIEDGLSIIKLYLAVNREEQARRLEVRRTDPLRTWKLSRLVEEGPRHCDEYTRAQNDLFVLHGLPYDGKDNAVARPPDPQVVGELIDMWPHLDRPA